MGHDSWPGGQAGKGMRKEIISGKKRTRKTQFCVQLQNAKNNVFQAKQIMLTTEFELGFTGYS